MTFDISKIFMAIGPAASIIFAAWIFMGYLQARSDSALGRYHAMIGTYRDGDMSEERRSNVRDQVIVYKRRCELMNTANTVGISAAILLIFTLISGEISIIVPTFTFLHIVSAVSALLGFTLVIVAAVFVLAESSIIQRQLDTELLDVADLAKSTGQHSGDVTGSRRSGSGSISRS